MYASETFRLQRFCYACKYTLLDMALSIPIDKKIILMHIVMAKTIREEIMRYDPRRLGEKIHEKRRREGLSIEELARRVGTGLPTISKIERGKRPRVSFDLIVRIAAELRLSLDDLVEEDEAELAAVLNN